MHYLCYWRPYRRWLHSLCIEARVHGNITIRLFMWFSLYSPEETVCEISLDIVSRCTKANGVRFTSGCCMPFWFDNTSTVAVAVSDALLSYDVILGKGTSNTAGLYAAGSMSFCNWKYKDTQIDGFLPKEPYPPCLRMADMDLLAGYPRYERFTNNSAVCCGNHCAPQSKAKTNGQS